MVCEARLVSSLLHTTVSRLVCHAAQSRGWWRWQLRHGSQGCKHVKVQEGSRERHEMHTNGRLVRRGRFAEGK